MGRKGGREEVAGSGTARCLSAIEFALIAERSQHK
jgi:hypothetical protein